jgi:hypothetical protein
LCEQGIQLVAALQLAQILGVGRRNVDGDIAGVRIHLAQTDEVIVRRFFYGRVGVLADVDTENTLEFGTLHFLNQRIHTVVVETHAVDDALRSRQTKQARLGIARLRARCDRADLNETEPERGECIDIAAILVQSCRQSDRIGEGQPHHLARIVRGALDDEWQRAQTMCGSQSIKCGVVGGLGIEREQGGAEQLEHLLVFLGDNGNGERFFLGYNSAFLAAPIFSNDIADLQTE